MANYDSGAGHLDEQGGSPEGMRQGEEQAPEQEESQHQEQVESDQEQQDTMAALETEHRTIQAQTMTQQGEMSQAQQEAEELVEPRMGQPDDAVKSSSQAESSEREAVSVTLEPVGGAGE